MDMLARSILVAIAGISTEFFYRITKALGDKRDVSAVDAAKELYRSHGSEYVFGGDAIPCGFKRFYIERVEEPCPKGSVIGKLVSLPI